MGVSWGTGAEDLPPGVDVKVVFERTPAAYLPGTSVVGRVILTLENQFAVTCIHVRCRGETVVSFVDADHSVRAWVPDSITTRKAAKQARVHPTASLKTAALVADIHSIGASILNVGPGEKSKRTDTIGSMLPAVISSAPKRAPPAPARPESLLSVPPSGQVTPARPRSLLSVAASERTSLYSQPMSLGTERQMGPQTVPVRATQTLLDQQRVLFGIRNSDYAAPLPAGQHQYPFRFVLPAELPPAFSGRYGFVRYLVTAVVERQIPLPSLSRAAAFSVIPEKGVSDVKHGSTATRSQASRFLCGFCCRRGPLTISLEVGRRAAAPGQSLPVSGEALNISGRVMPATSLRLMQLVTYRTGSGTSHLLDRRVVSGAERGPLPPGRSETFADLRLLVPPLPPSFSCPLIDVRYAVEVTMEHPDPVLTLRTAVPITIGTLPYLKPPADETQPVVETSTAALRLGAAYKHLPAYTLRPCFWGARSIEGDTDRRQSSSRRCLVLPGHDAWTPYYPVFREPDTELQRPAE
ncbi:uncharacterized protein LOC122391687 [Amphibalanus amphitrite]|uniref:uncharacterized protein LOC122391687 n=1 Tax=Amphibalanus amphitrite TaxID=1232801 RepID=UPI001C91B8E6|nr:uncharacterized protein LOC122391687 [Amphibalanus amphitrite]